MIWFVIIILLPIIIPLLMMFEYAVEFLCNLPTKETEEEKQERYRRNSRGYFTTEEAYKKWLSNLDKEKNKS